MAVPFRLPVAAGAVAALWLLAGATVALPGAAAPPDPGRAFEDRRLAPVRDWLANLPEAEADSAAALRARAWLARRAGDLEDALSLLDRAIERWPETAELYADRAAFRSDRLDDAGAMERMRIARDVRRDLERAVEVDPDDANALVGLIAFHRRAPGIVGGRDRRADELLDRLAELSPAHHATRLAMRNAEQQRFEKAADAMGRALEAAPDASRQWRLRHARWLRLADRHEAARQRLLDLLAAAPDYRPALFELGVLAREGGAAAPLGIDALRRYLALPHWPIDPAPALAWQELGRLYAAAGERAQARSALTRALGLNAELEPAREALDRINRASPD